MSDEVQSYRTRDEVYIERPVPLYACLTDGGVEDNINGKFRKRMPEEFTDAILAACEGLSEPSVQVRESYGSDDVVIYGSRSSNDDEKAEYDRRDRTLWLSAKGTYERGRDKWETP